MKVLIKVYRNQDLILVKRPFTVEREKTGHELKNELKALDNIRKKRKQLKNVSTKWFVERREG